MLYHLLRRFLFSLPPESAHAFVLDSLNKLSHLYLPSKQPPSSFTQVMGIDFPSRVGLAAGFDKNGDYISGLNTLGFGFLEIGTVTPKPQPGQSLPRVFRLVEDQALINRMGFPNKGIDYLVHRLIALSVKPVLGINIGKNADTPLEDALHDYRRCFIRVYPYADYVAVNLSSPNTPGLRELQGGRYLPHLLSALKAEQKRLAEHTGRYVPLVVKVSPDLTEAEIADIAHMLLEAEVEGLIATNTTVSRKGLQSSLNEAGGLSGAPLFSSSTSVLSSFKRVVGDKMALIGVGGIMNPSDAQAKFEAGADLVQIYTGLIYQGPGLIGRIKQLEKTFFS